MEKFLATSKIKCVKMIPRMWRLNFNLIKGIFWIFFFVACERAHPKSPSNPAIPNPDSQSVGELLRELHRVEEKLMTDDTHWSRGGGGYVDDGVDYTVIRLKKKDQDQDGQHNATSVVERNRLKDQLERQREVQKLKDEVERLKQQQHDLDNLANLFDPVKGDPRCSKSDILFYANSIQNPLLAPDDKQNGVPFTWTELRFLLRRAEIDAVAEFIQLVRGEVSSASDHQLVRKLPNMGITYPGEMSSTFDYNDSHRSTDGSSSEFTTHSQWTLTDSRDELEGALSSILPGILGKDSPSERSDNRASGNAISHTLTSGSDSIFTPKSAMKNELLRYIRGLHDGRDVEPSENESYLNAENADDEIFKRKRLELRALENQVENDEVKLLVFGTSTKTGAPEVDVKALQNLKSVSYQFKETYPHPIQSLLDSGSSLSKQEKRLAVITYKLSRLLKRRLVEKRYGAVREMLAHYNVSLSAIWSTSNPETGMGCMLGHLSILTVLLEGELLSGRPVEGVMGGSNTIIRKEWIQWWKYTVQKPIIQNLEYANDGKITENVLYEDLRSDLGSSQKFGDFRPSLAAVGGSIGEELLYHTFLKDGSRFRTSQVTPTGAQKDSERDWEQSASHPVSYRSPFPPLNDTEFHRHHHTAIQLSKAAEHVLASSPTTQYDHLNSADNSQKDSNLREPVFLSSLQEPELKILQLTESEFGTTHYAILLPRMLIPNPATPQDRHEHDPPPQKGQGRQKKHTNAEVTSDGDFAELISDEKLNNESIDEEEIGRVSVPITTKATHSPAVDWHADYSGFALRQFRKDLLLFFKREGKLVDRWCNLSGFPMSSEDTQRKDSSQNVFQEPSPALFSALFVNFLSRSAIHAKSWKRTKDLESDNHLHFKNHNSGTNENGPEGKGNGLEENGFETGLRVFYPLLSSYWPVSVRSINIAIENTMKKSGQDLNLDAALQLPFEEWYDNFLNDAEETDESKPKRNPPTPHGALFKSGIYYQHPKDSLLTGHFPDSLTLGNAFKVYVYDPWSPDLFDSMQIMMIGSPGYGRGNQRGVAGELYHWFLSCPCRTDDPSEADFFFVPQNTAVLTQMALLDYKTTDSNFRKAIPKLEFFNVTNGRDHVFVFSGGEGVDGPFKSWRGDSVADDGGLSAESQIESEATQVELKQPQAKLKQPQPWSISQSIFVMQEPEIWNFFEKWQHKGSYSFTKDILVPPLVSFHEAVFIKTKISDKPAYLAEYVGYDRRLARPLCSSKGSTSEHGSNKGRTSDNGGNPTRNSDGGVSSRGDVSDTADAYSRSSTEKLKNNDLETGDSNADDSKIDTDTTVSDKDGEHDISKTSDSDKSNTEINDSDKNNLVMLRDSDVRPWVDSTLDCTGPRNTLVKWAKTGKYEDLAIQQHIPPPEALQSHGNAHFCFCPRGISGYASRFVKTLLAMCTPIVLSDYYEIPFWQFLLSKKYGYQRHEVDWLIKWPMREMESILHIT